MRVCDSFHDRCAKQLKKKKLHYNRRCAGREGPSCHQKCMQTAERTNCTRIRSHEAKFGRVEQQWSCCNWDGGGVLVCMPFVWDAFPSFAPSVCIRNALDAHICNMARARHHRRWRCLKFVLQWQVSSGGYVRSFESHRINLHSFIFAFEFDRYSDCLRMSASVSVFFVPHFFWYEQKQIQMTTAWTHGPKNKKETYRVLSNGNTSNRICRSVPLLAKSGRHHRERAKISSIIEFRRTQTNQLLCVVCAQIQPTIWQMSNVLCDWIRAQTSFFVPPIVKLHNANVLCTERATERDRRGTRL